MTKQSVVACTPIEQVNAVTALQFIIPVIPKEAVGSFASKQHIVLRPTEERIVTDPALQMIVAGAAIQEIHSTRRTERRRIVQPVAIK